MKKSLLLFFIFILTQTGFTQNNVEWQRLFGGSWNDVLNSAIQTQDGGYLISGETHSSDGDITGNHGYIDILIIKLDDIGNIQWSKCYGGSSWETVQTVLQLSDGGYIIGGTTESVDGNVSGNDGSKKIWIIRINALGEILWENCYGDTIIIDLGFTIQQTNDNDFIISGSVKPDISNYLDNNVQVFKINNIGALLWLRYLGGASKDDFKSCRIINGNECLLAIETRSINESSYGPPSIYIAKLSKDGEVEWSNCYGGCSSESFQSFLQTADSNYIIAGSSNSIGGLYAGHHGLGDIWLVKLTKSGEILWEKFYGGSSTDKLLSIHQTTDNGFILTGKTKSNDGDLTGPHGLEDIWVVKLNESGDILWQNSIEGSNNEFPVSIQESPSNGFILFGITESTDGDVLGNHVDNDIWVVKLNEQGEIQWQKCIGGYYDDSVESLLQIDDTSYIILGTINSDYGDIVGSYGKDDICLIKITQNGNVLWEKCIGTNRTDFSNIIVQMKDESFMVIGRTGTNAFDNRREDIIIHKLCPGNQLNVSIDLLNNCNVTLDATPGFISYLWNTGDTTSSISANMSYNYQLIAINEQGCSSSIVIPFSDYIIPYPSEEICSVTIDSASNGNTILIESHPFFASDSIAIYRQSPFRTGFDKIGAISIHDESFFIDKLNDNIQGYYQYKISTKDICGQQSELSNAVSNLYLQADRDQDGHIILKWIPDIGLNYNEVKIYRQIEGQDFKLIAQASNTEFSYIDKFPPQGIIRYKLKILQQMSCTIGGQVYPYINSNIESINDIGISKPMVFNIQRYPNPTTDHLTIKWDAQTEVNTLEIFDAFGKIRDVVPISGTTSQQIIDVSNYTNGFYLIRINKQYYLKFLKQ